MFVVVFLQAPIESWAVHEMNIGDASVRNYVEPWKNPEIRDPVSELIVVEARIIPFIGNSKRTEDGTKVKPEWFTLEVQLLSCRSLSLQFLCVR